MVTIKTQQNLGLIVKNIRGPIPIERTHERRDFSLLYSHIIRNNSATNMAIPTLIPPQCSMAIIVRKNTTNHCHSILILAPSLSAKGMCSSLKTCLPFL